MHTRLKAFTIIFISLFTKCYSQDSAIQLEGNVISSDENPIPYVSIGLLGKPIGTVSDSLGHFAIYLDRTKHLGDVLRFSSIGYSAKEINLTEINLKENLNITLKDSITVLSEVIIREDLNLLSQGKDKISSKRVVNFALSGQNNQNLGAVIGRRFNFSSNFYNQLLEFNFFVKYNNFNYIKLRINFYALTKGKPGKILNPTPLYIELKNAFKGWVFFDLSGSKIIISEDIVVGIEWIEHSGEGTQFSLPIIIPSIGSTHFYTYGSQDKWKKFREISTPMIIYYKREKRIASNKM